MSTDFEAKQAQTGITGLLIIKANHPEFKQAQQRADSIQEQFLEGGVKLLSELAKEVSTMPIASTRFSPTRKMLENDLRVDERTFIETMNPDLTEAEHKRIQLLDDLRQANNEYHSLANRLAALVMDIEATRTED